MVEIKIYIAGKVSPNSVFGTHDWRDSFCEKLSEQIGIKIFNLDPTKAYKDFNLDENNSKLIFGRDCFMIKTADIVIVNLTDDISVGGSQEMLIAKYFSKPLIGIAPKGGKFNKEKTKFIGKEYENWIHPFVNIPCDIIVEDITEAETFIKQYITKQQKEIKNISIIDNSIEYYKKHHHHLDKFLN
ncbi:MAG: hypothetical protein KC589_10380 [Nanoarchaeota archaeon]|nr:hypothetical protein [Nanoarchaeota archaeon]